jgi:hypothetical protein
MIDIGLSNTLEDCHQTQGQKMPISQSTCI